MATGEIQSTNHPAIQNAIYAVGSLLHTDGTKPILCLTLFKNKTAQLAVAKLKGSSYEHNRQPVVGEVSLKYVISPAPMDLTTRKGVVELATRLFNMLK